MIRNCSLEEISDGKLYSENDMVKTDTNQCQGCNSVCCHGMGDSIVLDPYDICRLTRQLQMPFESLVEKHLALNVVDGVILPNLKMAGENETCTFLNEQQRCRIHGARPGICRLFPLGRYYENGGFSYFLQTGECAKENRSKIKVSKWIDTPDLTRNQQFTLQWHDLLHAMEERLTGEDEGKQQEENLLLLRLFYLLPYKGTTDFYSQFMERMEYWNEQIR